MSLSILNWYNNTSDITKILYAMCTYVKQNEPTHSSYFIIDVVENIFNNQNEWYT